MHAFTFFHIALFLCVRWVIQEAHWMQPSVQLIRLKTLAPMHQTTWQHMDLSPGEQLVRLKPLLPVHQRNLAHSYIDIFWCISMYPQIYISIYHYIYTSMYISPHCLQHRYLNDGNEFVRLIKNHFVFSLLNLCLFIWIMLNAHACRRAPNLERLKFKDRFFLMSKGNLSSRTDRLWKIDLQMWDSTRRHRKLN